MLIDYKFSSGGVVVRFKIRDASSSSGAGLKSLNTASTGLRIAATADSEAAATSYTAAGGTIDTIATLGTYAAPTTGHCRFKEFDPTNHPGWYEFHFETSRFAV